MGDVGRSVDEADATTTRVPFFGIFANGLLRAVVTLRIGALVHGLDASATGHAVVILGDVGEAGTTPAGVAFVGVDADGVNVAVDAVFAGVDALVDSLATDTTGLGGGVGGDVGVAGVTLTGEAFGQVDTLGVGAAVVESSLRAFVDNETAAVGKATEPGGTLALVGALDEDAHLGLPLVATDRVVHVALGRFRCER